MNADDDSRVLWFASTRSTRPRSTRTPRATRSVGTNGDLVVEWGTALRISELSDDGALLVDATLPDVRQRAFGPV